MATRAAGLRLMEKALASGDFTNATAAPRVEADPWAGENLHWRTSRWVLRSLDGILGEWRELYGEVPPESSLLLRKYRQLYPLPAAASARGVRVPRPGEGVLADETGVGVESGARQRGSGNVSVVALQY